MRLDNFALSALIAVATIRMVIPSMFFIGTETKQKLQIWDGEVSLFHLQHRTVQLQYSTPITADNALMEEVIVHVVHIHFCNSGTNVDVSE